MKAEWVKPMLVKWGEWRAGSGRGFGGGSYPAYDLVHIHGTSGGVDMLDGEILQIDRILAGIKLAKPELYAAAYEIYAEGSSHQTAAGRLRCHRDTVYARINALHVLVEDQVMTQRKSKVATNKETFP